MAQQIYSHSQSGIIWQVHLRSDLNQAGAQRMVEFRKLGKHGKLLDQVIGWRPSGWCQAPSSRIPKYLLERITVLLRDQLEREASSDATAAPASLIPEPAPWDRYPATSKTPPGLVFPSFLSAQLLAQHCPGYLQRHTTTGA